MYFSIGIVLIHGFGVFILPIAEDTGWDRRSIAAVVAPVALVNGLMSPLVGVLTDRFGPRSVLTVSSVTTGVGLAGIGLTSGSLSAFVAAVVLASILGGAQTGVPYTQVVVGWFNARRGLALGADALVRRVGHRIGSADALAHHRDVGLAFRLRDGRTGNDAGHASDRAVPDPGSSSASSGGRRRRSHGARSDDGSEFLARCRRVLHELSRGRRGLDLDCPSSLRTEGCRQAMPPSS